MKISFHQWKENKVDALFMGWETLTLSVFSVATLQNYQDKLYWKRPYNHITYTSLYAHLAFLLGPSKLTKRWIRKTTLTKQFYFTVKEMPGSPITSAISEMSLFRLRHLNQDLVPQGILHSFTKRWTNPRLKTLSAHHTHFVFDGLKVRSKASKLHVSFLITFQLGTLKIQSQRQFLLRTCIPLKVVTATT